MRRSVASGWFVFALVTSCLAGPAIADDAKGVWLREEGLARVKISTCGAALCGTVVWLKNPDGPAKVGERVFINMKPSGENVWAGAAFNPEDGNTYDGKMTVSGNQMVTTGCALAGLICKSVTWTR